MKKEPVRGSERLFCQFAAAHRFFFVSPNNNLVWLLDFAPVVAWFTESQLESVAILVVLLLNALIRVVIVCQASRSLNALRKATHTTSRRRRDGKEQIIDAIELVTDDQVNTAQLINNWQHSKIHL